MHRDVLSLFPLSAQTRASSLSTRQFVHCKNRARIKGLEAGEERALCEGQQGKMKAQRGISSKLRAQQHACTQQHFQHAGGICQPYISTQLISRP